MTLRIIAIITCIVVSSAFFAWNGQRKSINSSISRERHNPDKIFLTRFHYKQKWVKNYTVNIKAILNVQKHKTKLAVTTNITPAFASYGTSVKLTRYRSDSPSVVKCCLPKQECTKRPLPERVPERFDWRSTGYVGPVLKQRVCNVCWAFSIIGVMETLAANITGIFTQLSIQEVMDLYESHCGYGNSADATDTICNYHKNSQYAITTEEDYPLVYRNQSIQKAVDKGWWLRSYEVYRNVTASEIKKLIVSRGPVVAKVNSHPWRFYLDGIIQYHCDNTNYNHAVQIVGYVTDTEIPYYIIRNSAGPDFGDHGYLKIAMKDFICGIGVQIVTLDVYNNF